MAIADPVFSHAAQDPGNIGTILRTSDAVGGSGLILLADSADPYHPSSVRASMGALFAQAIALSREVRSTKPRSW